SPPNPGYGAQVWLNRPGPGGFVQWPGAPASVFSMNGHLGQHVLVNRVNGMVVVRLGKTQDNSRDPLRKALARLVTLYPKGPTT
ncbi:MAG: serine hydrolase, partial [Novosphingobium sp.]